MTPDTPEAPSRGALTTLDRVLIAIVALTLAGTCLLISAGPGTKAGHRPWSPNSVLRVLTDLMALYNHYPTIRSVEIKWLVHGLGAAAVVLAGAIAWFARTRRDQDETPDLAAPEALAQPVSARGLKTEVTPASAAQACLVLFVGWSLLSAAWAPWRAVALGEGLRFFIWAAWAIVLGRTLSRFGVRLTMGAMVLVLGVTAVVGVWYYYERNPFLRLEFPIGNPIFTAACLLPGLTIAGAVLMGTASEALDRLRARGPAPAQSVSSVTQLMGGRATIIAAFVCLLVMAWAFWLTDSRGPTYALVLGVAAAVWMVAPRSIRWGVPVIIVLLLVLPVALRWRSMTSIEEGGRGATIRMRVYAWRYAADLFLSQPVVGHGEGSYALLAQGMQRQDMEKDPAAFPAAVLGHAHNEYLEILSELGIIGFTLYLMVMVLTVWAALSAWRLTTQPLQQWCLVGLMAAFVAMACEELFDVALRKPGLPVFFYTTMGLIWASSARAIRPSGPMMQPQPPLVRVLGLFVGIVGAAGIASASWRDWEGALADYQMGELADQGHWSEALAAADVACGHRLAVDDYLSAYYRKMYVGFRAASDQFERSRAMAARWEQRMSAAAARPRPAAGEGRGPEAQMPTQAGVTQLAREDQAQFETYAAACEQAGATLLDLAPFYPQVAEVLADLLLTRQQMETVENRLGLQQEVHDYSGPARGLMAMENLRDPQDLRVALKLFALSGKESVAYRLDLLRKPLRRGPVQLGSASGQFAIDPLGELEAPLASLIREGGFYEPMDQLLAKAREALDAPSAASWPDPYAPESLRLVARLEKLLGRFDRAATLAGQAAELSKKIRMVFPGTVSNALLDQARYLLLAHPDDAQRAVDVCEQAIEEWPKVYGREEQLRPVRQTLAFYILAAGEEQKAREVLKAIYPQVSEAELARRLGQGYAELCEVFVKFPPAARPTKFSRWLDRALVLLPDSPPVHVLAAQAALEANDQAAAVEQLRTAADLAFAQSDDAAGVEYLRMLARVLNDRKRLMEIVDSLLRRYPQNPTLPRLISSGLLTAATAPATSSAPASAPATSLPFPVPARP